MQQTISINNHVILHSNINTHNTFSSSETFNNPDAFYTMQYICCYKTVYNILYLYREKNRKRIKRGARRFIIDNEKKKEFEITPVATIKLTKSI